MASVKIKGYYFKLHPKAEAPRIWYKGRTLADVYDSWSDAKERAYEHCVEMYYNLEGWDFAITGANRMTFSVVFDFEHPETGELMRAYITRDYNHAYYL